MYKPIVVFVEGAGFEPAMSYAFFAAYPRHYPFSDYSSVAFDLSAILPLYCALRFRRKVSLPQ